MSWINIIIIIIIIISGPLTFRSEKRFPSKFSQLLSWVISKSKDFSFCKYAKLIF